VKVKRTQIESSKSVICPKDQKAVVDVTEEEKLDVILQKIYSKNNQGQPMAETGTVDEYTNT